MLLAADIGNSRIKLGIFDRGVMLKDFSASAPELGLDGISEDLDGAIICSVVPASTDVLAAAIRARFSIEPVIVRNDVDFGIEVLHEPIESMGADRLVNSYAAVELFGPPCIVCSFGTALTIDYVDKNRTLRGGLIAPGMRILASALAASTARLPEVAIERPTGILQHTTKEAVQSGIVNGFLMMTDAMLAGIKAEMSDDCKVVATGGWAEFVASNLRVIDFVEPQLLLKGLQRLFDRQMAVNL